MGVLSQLVERPWIRAWKLLLVLSSVYFVASIAFAMLVVTNLEEEQGHAAGFAALAAILLMGVVFIAYIVALIATILLKRETAKPLVGVSLIAGGAFVYLTSGLFVGFLPMFVIATVAGLLAIYESLV